MGMESSVWKIDIERANVRKKQRERERERLLDR